MKLVSEGIYIGQEKEYIEKGDSELSRAICAAKH
jgi:hypothetical protein